MWQLNVAALQAHERYRDLNGQVRLALCQERNPHLQGLAERAGKLLQIRNTGETYRLVQELGGITRGGPPRPCSTLHTGALVLGAASVPATAEHFAGVLSAIYQVINPVAEELV